MSAYIEITGVSPRPWPNTRPYALFFCAIMAAIGAFDVHAAEVVAPQAGFVQAAPRRVDNVSSAVVGILPGGPDALPMPVEALPLISAADPDPRVSRMVATRQHAFGKTGYVLGLSWLPAFCETRGKRAECLEQSAERADAKQLTLAGLWPVRNSFCKVSEALQASDRKRDWQALPVVPLSAEVAAKLKVAMPGTASGFDRHTWLRSGSCQMLEPDAYFSLQIRLLDAVNTSAVGALFRSRIGRAVTEAEVKAAFDQSFAAGAGDRIRLQCRQVGDRMLVTGLTIGLSATMEETSDLAVLVHGAAPTRSRCDGGIIDAAGHDRSGPRARIGQVTPETGGVATVVDVR